MTGIYFVLDLNVNQALSHFNYTKMNEIKVNLSIADKFLCDSVTPFLIEYNDQDDVQIYTQ